MKNTFSVKFNDKSSLELYPCYKPNITNFLGKQWIEQFHKFKNATVPYLRMLHSEQKCAHFCSEWSLLGYGTSAFWDLWIRSIVCYHSILIAPQWVSMPHNLHYLLLAPILNSVPSRGCIEVNTDVCIQGMKYHTCIVKQTGHHVCVCNRVLIYWPVASIH